MDTRNARREASRISKNKRQEIIQDQKNLTRRITIRFTEKEAQRLHDYADMAQISLSEYVRKALWGGRPTLPRTDTKMISELRRIGGLLKHNFETMRKTNAPKQCFEIQEEALCKLIDTLERLAIQDNSQT